MKFDQLCTVISLLYCTGMHVLALYYFSLSNLVSECYLQRNDILSRLKCITGGWGNTTFVMLSKLFTHEIIRKQTYSIYKPIHPTLGRNDCNSVALTYHMDNYFALFNETIEILILTVTCPLFFGL